MDWKSRRIDAIVEQALVEDKATDDATTLITIDAGLRGTGTVMAKQDCVIAGLGVIPRVLAVFARLEGRSEASFEVVSHPEIFDSVRVRKGQSLAVIRTTARTLLSTERVILNLLQRMSGIATLTRRYADAVQATGTTVIDTRKTVPGLRVLDKYAVTCGGGENHRLDLSDGILIKNNHIALGGGVARVLANAHRLRKAGQVIDIEVRSFAELDEALEHGAESLLLDNMTPDEVKRAIGVVRERGLKIPIEASGGMTLETIGAYAQAGPDYISVGALTHSAVAVDLNMRITAELG
ncbi:carboxylating nicotinate-nucleotide diphosphorylase [Acidipila sp. EB88]|uniref:carboxylating nicotinate-nucleotide diphosphorylase n=1 Tax=Acidipila sp. EB88 TaxID=2305226 RepID=UPI000F5EBC85|nr:carboxylating nicotinate-nucleotide diphosphorylase [Acidipila sp. EB88]RRA48638.1 carboxylating nicotinate-nucleotide diphosphorylase [Acidipila sp. EB88]